MVKIRKMSAADIDTFMQLGLNTDKKILLELIQSPNHVLLTAREDKVIVGFSLAAYDPNLPASYTYVLFLKKEEEEKKQDIYKKLLTQTLVQLQTLDYNNALKLAQLDNETIKDFSIRYALQISELLNPLLK